jgi:amino acid transporter, AAT family
MILAVLITTAFTHEFRMTLTCGLPFIVLLTLAYHLWYRGQPLASCVAAQAIASRARR